MIECVYVRERTAANMLKVESERAHKREKEGKSQLSQAASAGLAVRPDPQLISFSRGIYLF